MDIEKIQRANKQSHNQFQVSRPPENSLGAVTQVKKKKPKSNIGNTITLVLVIVGALVLLAATFYNYTQASKNAEKFVAKEQESKANDVAAQVGQHFNVPNNETPSVAEVSDPKKLANDPFFLNAKKGDVILAYPKARLAVIYRPSTEQVIASGPVTGEIPSQPKQEDSNGNQQRTQRISSEDSTTSKKYEIF